MKHLNASGSSRFFAFLLDYTIIGFVADIILSNIIFPIIKFDPNLLVQKLQIFYQDTAQGVLDYELAGQIITLSFIQLGLTFAVMIPIVVGYLCVLPHFWEKQTVGRLLLGLKVVDVKDEGKVYFSKLLLRELVGGFLLTYVIGSSFMILLIIIIYMSTSSGRSLADKVGKTRLINLKFVVSNGSEFDFFSNNKKDEYVDAKFTDVEPEKFEEKKNDDSSDDYMVF